MERNYVSVSLCMYTETVADSILLNQAKLFQLCITRFEKNYLWASIRDCCTKSLRLCPRVTVSTLFATKRADTSASTMPNSHSYT